MFIRLVGVIFVTAITAAVAVVQSGEGKPMTIVEEHPWGFEAPQDHDGGFDSEGLRHPYPASGEGPIGATCHIKCFCKDSPTAFMTTASATVDADGHWEISMVPPATGWPPCKGEVRLYSNNIVVATVVIDGGGGFGACSPNAGDAVDCGCN